MTDPFLVTGPATIASAYMPIETAPRDGTLIEGAAESHWAWDVLRFPYPLKVRWDDQAAKWRANDGRIYDPQPTHWKPAPEPLPAKLQT